MAEPVTSPSRVTTKTSEGDSVGIEVQLTDGTGERRLACIDLNRGLRVAQTYESIPEIGQRSQYRYFTGKLGQNGVDDTTDMAVDGSSTAVEYTIGSNETYDIHIMGIAILLADSSVSHNNFGNISALSTGWDLEIVEAGETTVLVNKAQTGGQLIAQTGLARPYGNSSQSFELSNWTGATDAQTIWFPMSEYIPGGLRIPRGSNDKILARVNDNITGLTEMFVQVYGYRHYPPDNVI